MASPTARVTFRVILAILVILVLFYVGRPLYWKISATIHDIRHNKQTVSGGISQIVYEAQRTVGWYHDESDSGVRDTKHSARRILRQIRSNLQNASNLIMRVAGMAKTLYFGENMDLSLKVIIHGSRDLAMLHDSRVMSVMSTV